jgi:hypothetical protein
VPGAPRSASFKHPGCPPRRSSGAARVVARSEVSAQGRTSRSKCVPNRDRSARAGDQGMAARAVGAIPTLSRPAVSRSTSVERPFAFGPTATLAGGEAQRAKMIRHLGPSLTDVTYVFDEPTAGLHPRDVQRMNNLLLRLREGQHCARRRARAGDDSGCRPRRRSRARCRNGGPAVPSPVAISTTG